MLIRINCQKNLDEIGEEEVETIEGSKKDFPDEISKLEEALPNYLDEMDLKNLKTEFPDTWKQLTKYLAYP